jgi:hypothetical protein
MGREVQGVSPSEKSDSAKVYSFPEGHRVTDEETPKEEEPEYEVEGITEVASEVPPPFQPEANPADRVETSDGRVATPRVDVPESTQDVGKSLDNFKMRIGLVRDETLRGQLMERLTALQKIFFATSGSGATPIGEDTGRRDRRVLSVLKDDVMTLEADIIKAASENA